jgi:integrase
MAESSLASVRARADSGLLFLDFRWKGRRYRRQTTLADTPANRERLDKVLGKIRKQIEAGTFDYSAFFPDSSGATPKEQGGVQAAPAMESPLPATQLPRSRVPLFRDFIEVWLRERQVEWRRSHLRTLKSTIDRHLLPCFGQKQVSQINRADIMEFRAALASTAGRKKGQRLSNKRINGIIGPLKQVLTDAAERFEFPSPVATLKPLKIRKSDVQPFSLAEVDTILDTVRADYRDYLLVRFFTGMRSGEADGLKWKYIDFERRLILVREAFVLGEDEYTKTDGSQRDIQMSTPVYEALKRQEAATRNLSDYVFCNKQGNPIDNKNFTERVWRPLLKHLGFDVRRPYQMRHTAATLWLAAGENPEWIARQLGHTSTQMLFKVYSRFVPNMTRQDGAAIERLLAASVRTKPMKDRNVSERA